MSSYLLVNFGGPRHLDEVPPFLEALLCDRDLIRTPFPNFFHNWFFRRVARKRAIKVAEDYELIGGKSPIYFDTEALAVLLAQKLQAPVSTFHRYLPSTHADSLRQIENPIVIPLFPQFCYATTGSIARFFSPHFPHLQWVKSYAGHPAFILAYQKKIRAFLTEKNLKEEEIVLFFSAHGVPKKFIDQGDPYKSDCELSYREVMKAFPKALGHLCYQSKFGKGEWLRPYTNEMCEQVKTWNSEGKAVVFIPISFTSDHIETLFEIEHLYLPIVRKAGLNAYRCPALNLEPYWVEALAAIARESHLYPNHLLIR